MICRLCKISARTAVALIGVIVLAIQPAWAQAPKINWSLDEAIRQIERQADDFQTGMARVETVRTGDDGAEISRSTGTGFIHRDGDMRYNIDGGKLVTFVDNHTVSNYNAETKTVEEYSLRKHKNRLEPYARLGFSTTGKDMEDDYLITIIGEEEIGSSRTLVMELTPEKDSVRETVRLVRLYIDQASWMPVRQVFKSTIDGTTLKITYTGMARNLDLKPELFRDKWPRGTETVKK
jgi:outer membrane lipoprotein-sorting protein